MISADFSIIPMQTDADKEGKACVHWRSWHETYTGLMPQPYLDRVTLEKCTEWAYRWSENTLVLKHAGKVVGFSCYGTPADAKDADTGEVVALYVLREYHGQQLGYALMNATLDALRGKHRVFLWVLQGNARAVHFYTRYGFRFDGTEKTAAFGTELRMVLEKPKA